MMKHGVRLAVAFSLALTAASAGWAQTPGSAAWVGLAFDCDDCAHGVDASGTRWRFGSPPKIYSVEHGSPAYTAGLRRGDVLTHIDGRAITSEEGGRRWAALQPGEAARITYRRDATSRTVTLRPGQPRGVAPAAAAATLRSGGQAYAPSRSTQDTVLRRIIREQQAALEQDRARQEEVLSNVLSRARNASPADRRQIERTLQEYTAAQSVSRARQQRQLEELVRLHAVEAQGFAPARVPLTQGTVVTSASTLTRSDQKLRYSGTFSGLDVEVRGATSVVVSERGDELIITTPETTIRIRKPHR